MQWLLSLDKYLMFSGFIKIENNFLIIKNNKYISNMVKIIYSVIFCGESVEKYIDEYFWNQSNEPWLNILINNANNLLLLQNVKGPNFIISIPACAVCPQGD